METIKRYTQRFVTWRGATLIILLVIWSLFVWSKGYDEGRGEPDRLQKEIDKAKEQNRLLSNDLDLANSKMIDMDKQHNLKLSEWKDKHKRLQSNKEVPASLCVGEDDYYGTDHADKFSKELEIKKDGLLREKD